MNARFIFFSRICLFVILIICVDCGCISWAAVSRALPRRLMTITPITWNIIGLDSSNVYVGPNSFPVGARVCKQRSARRVKHLTGVTASSGVGFSEFQSIISLLDQGTNHIIIRDIHASAPTVLR